MNRQRHRHSWQGPKEESPKETFQRLLSELKIRNDKQYDVIIAQNDALKRAESYMNLYYFDIKFTIFKEKKQQIFLHCFSLFCFQHFIF